MRTIGPVLAMAAALLLAAPTMASEDEAEPPEPLGPPVFHVDPAGDVPDGTPDLVGCGVSEPFESLLRFELEFATDPPLGYDLETWTTDELWLTVATEPGAVMPDDMEYALIVHGATLPAVAESGSGLYDATAAEGDEVFWGVVDVEVDGPVIALAVDRKLLGDPETIYFAALVAAEGTDEYDSCPDEDIGPTEYELYG